MNIQNQLLAILTAGWLAIRGADPTRRERTSPAGIAAAETVRRLSMLLGNAATADMVAVPALGFARLLALLSSPVWLQSRVSQRARQVAFDVANRVEDWASPQGLDGGGDDDLRGAPGGEAKRAVQIWLGAGIGPAAYASEAIRQIPAWRALDAAATAWRQAGPIVGALEALVGSGGRVPNMDAAVQVIRREYADELAWLATPEGARLVPPGAEVRIEAVAVPNLPFSDAVVAIQQEIGRRQFAGTVRRPGQVWMPSAPDLDLGSAAGRQDAPADTDAPSDTAETPAPAAKAKKSSAAWAWGLGLGAAVIGVIALAARPKRRRRRR